MPVIVVTVLEELRDKEATLTSGAAGLELARRAPVEAVILDILMPGLSGLEVLEHLHAQDPDFPVIMLTAHPSS